MALHEETLREQYTALLAAFKAAFPHIVPPDASWWIIWLNKYDFGDIREAITTLSRHSLKSRFTRESTGKAISALLREAALRRAVASVPTTGGVRS